jgi:hypothetical protein
MNYRDVQTTGEYLARLDTGGDWRGQIEALAAEVEAEAAWFQAMGAVQDAECWFYDQDEQRYDAITFDEELEVAACVGNISWLDGERFAHTHAVLSHPDGTAVAGHLNEATVFAGEVYLRTFAEPLVREHDDRTDLDLWL